MPAPSRARRAARFAVIAALAALAVAATTFDGPRTESEATVLAAVVSDYRGAEVGQAAAVVRRAPLICIDPGHSETDPGMVVTVTTIDASGRRRDQSLREVDINIDVAREVVGTLRQRFGDDAVVMTWGEADGRTRPWDALAGPTGDEKLDLMMRGAFCIRHRTRSLASLHTNWFGDAANGVYVGYRDDADRAMAEALHPRLREAMAVDPAGRPVPDFIDYGLDPGEWFIMLGLGAAEVPAVILEPVMMSNSDEARRLLPTIADAPDGRRAQIARVEAQVLGDWIESALLGKR